MPVVKLTAKNVDKLSALGGQRHTDYFDETLKNFVLRVTDLGIRT